MLEVEQALQMVLERIEALPASDRDLSEVLGDVLATDVTSDIDSPPHDKAMVDGYAVITADVATAPTTLRVIEEVTAGEVPKEEVVPGTAIRIMTGAPVPKGTERVIMVEHTETPIDTGDRPAVTIHRPLDGGRTNIMERATSLARNSIVLHRGQQVTSGHVGLLAEVGHATVKVVPRPSVAIISTGNELVPVGSVPESGQIRNSNGPMLAAQVESAGATAVSLGIGRDDREHLASLIRRGLEEDILVLSGGVSAGVLDLVPGVLAEENVQQVFHKVRVKPGKPVWFGVCERGEKKTYVFGLPGNPVSTLVCFELFVRAAIDKLAGRSRVGRPKVDARVASEYVHRGDRPAYLPARIEHHIGGRVVSLLNWKGSADLCGLANANALAIFPAGDRDYQTGDEISVLLLDGAN